MYLKQMYNEFARLSEYGQGIGLLLARLAVSYGFYSPAMSKWADVRAVSEWFGSLGIPFPAFNAYLVATMEATGVVLLALGLLTRLISIPLIVVMIVAIFSVHIGNGFSAGNNGFEIPLYYMLFLFIFLSHGGGRFSLDSLIFDKQD